MNKIFITGVTGFIGRAIAERLSNNGYDVVGSSSRQNKDKSLLKFVDEVYQIPFLSDVDESVFAQVKCVIHCAFDRNAKNKMDNFKGTLKFCSAAASKGVLQQIFLSTISVNEKNVSEYARSKKKLEDVFIEKNLTVIRPGLVVGRGGLFLRIKDILKKFPITPLLDGGNNQIQIVYINDLVKVMEVLVHKEKRGTYTIVSEVITLKKLLTEIKSIYGYKSLELSVPINLVKWPVWFCELLRLPLPINVNNLKGLQSNSNFKLESDLENIIGSFTPINKALGEIYESEINGKN